MESIRPMLLKAGLPIALSMAGFMCARIMAVKYTSLPETRKVNPLETHSQSDSTHDDNFQIHDPLVGEVMDSRTRIGYSGDGVSGLESRVEGLQKREEEVEKRFLHYLELKEQESALVELKNMLALEIAHAELLSMEVSSIDGESKRFRELGGEFVKVANQIEKWRLENGVLRRKVKRLTRKSKVHVSVVRENNVKIEDREAEILRTRKELETRCDVVKNLEEEVKELRIVLGRFEEDKNDLLKKLDLADREKEAAAISKDYAGRVKTEKDYSRIVNELELLQKERTEEVKELTYLRWSNVCLRQKLMQDQDPEMETHTEPEHEETGESEDRAKAEDHLDDYHICSKRRRFAQKLRRWVEGSEKVKPRLSTKENHNLKCFFGKHSVSDGEEEHHRDSLLHGRKSSSSA